MHSISCDFASSISAPIVMGIGTAYYDLEARVNKIFMESLPYPVGEWSKESDLELFNQLLDQVRAHLGTSTLKATLGGSAGNVVRTLQALGTPSALFCKLGRDRVSDEYRRAMISLGAGMMIQPSETPVSRILVLIEGGNRKFICNQTLSLDLEPASLSEKTFEGIKSLHIEGYSVNEFQIEFLEKAMKLAKKAEALVSIDLGADWVVKSNIENILRLLSHVDIVFANEAEVMAIFDSAASLLRPEETENDSSQEKVAALLLERCSTVVFLQGAQGARIFSKQPLDGVLSFISPANLLEEGVEPNTNGAGDAFIAGFLHGILQKHTLEESAWIGNLLGGTVVKFDGTQIPEELWPSLRGQIQSHLEPEAKVG